MGLCFWGVEASDSRRRDGIIGYGAPHKVKEDQWGFI